MVTGSRADTIDSFDDTGYEQWVTPGYNNSTQLSSSYDRTEGPSCVEVQYKHNPTPARGAENSFTRILRRSMDLSTADTLSIDVNVPAAKPGVVLAISFYDDKGGAARIVDQDIFAAPTDGWKTRTYRLADLQKSRGTGSGRAVNLRRITRVTYSLLVAAPLDAAGGFVFRLDNLRTALQPAMRREVRLDAGASWRPAEGTSLSVARATTGGVSSTPLEMTARIDGVDWRPLARTGLASPVDLGSALYVRLPMRGDPALARMNPTLALGLVDTNGNRADGLVVGWPGDSAEAVVLLPFNADGVEGYASGNPEALEFGGGSCWREGWQAGRDWQTKTDLGHIAALEIGMRGAEPAESPLTATLRLGAVTVGFDPGVRPVEAGKKKAGDAGDSPRIVQWLPASDLAVSVAKSNHRPAVIYFQNPDVPQCAAFEQKVLTTAEFARHSAGFTCLLEDNRKERELADTYGMFRVPGIVVLGPDGRVAGSLSYDIEPGALYELLDSAR